MLESETTAETGTSTPLAHSHYSVADLPGHHRFDEWRESISCIFEVEATRDVRQDDFSASVDGHLLDALMLAETKSRPQMWTRTSQRIAADGMDHYMVQLFRDGVMASDQGSNGEVLPAGGLVVFDLARAAKAATNDFTNVSLILPRDLVSPYLKAPDDQHLRFFDASQPLVRLLHNQIATLRAIAPDMTHAQAAEVMPHVVGLVSACLNGTVNGSPTNGSDIPLATISIVKKIIVSRLGEAGVTPADIARQAGLSRSKLYEIFESYGGVARYIRERRLRNVARHLADPAMGRRPIYEIALANGFENAAAFTRAFRGRFDQSPRDYRESAKSLRRVDLTRRSGRRENYETWLHQL